MLKKLFLITGMIFFIFCASVSADGGELSIMPIRTGEKNTYLISVSYYNRDKEVINQIDPIQIYNEFITEYECVLTIDNDKEKSIGKGKVNRFYKMDGGLYWEYVYKFNSEGEHDIYAEIYKNGKLIEDDDVEINVNKAALMYAINNNTYLKNQSFAYRMINEINKKRDGNGLFNLGMKTDYFNLAEERLMYALRNNDFSHDGLDEIYKKYKINTSDKKEFYVKGGSSVEETLSILLKNEAAASCIYGKYINISVCAAYDDKTNIMYWVLELYK